MVPVWEDQVEGKCSLTVCRWQCFDRAVPAQFSERRGQGCNAATSSLVGVLRCDNLHGGVQEHVIDGLENAAESLQLLFSGGNQGKLLIKIADRSPRSKL